MIFEFCIVGRLAGTNEIIKADRAHWAKGARLRKLEMKKVRAPIWEVMIGQNARFSDPVRISFCWIEKDRRRDVDNITGGQKVIIDALVSCGVLAGDGRAQVAELHHTFPDPEKVFPRIVVRVEPV